MRLWPEPFKSWNPWERSRPTWSRGPVERCDLPRCPARPPRVPGRRPPTAGRGRHPCWHRSIAVIHHPEVPDGLTRRPRRRPRDDRQGSAPDAGDLSHRSNRCWWRRPAGARHLLGAQLDMDTRPNRSIDSPAIHTRTTSPQPLTVTDNGHHPTASIRSRAPAMMPHPLIGPLSRARLFAARVSAVLGQLEPP